MTSYEVVNAIGEVVRVITRDEEPDEPDTSDDICSECGTDLHITINDRCPVCMGGYFDD